MKKKKFSPTPGTIEHFLYAVARVMNTSANKPGKAKHYGTSSQQVLNSSALAIKKK